MHNGRIGPVPRNSKFRTTVSNLFSAVISGQFQCMHQKVILWPFLDSKTDENLSDSFGSATKNELFTDSSPNRTCPCGGEPYGR